MTINNRFKLFLINGDGQTFTSNDDQTKLLVWGTYYEDDFADNYKSSMSEYGLKYIISYSTLENAYFVISGSNSQKIFYYKLFKIKGRYVGIYMEYPLNQKTTWSTMIQTIANSVKSTE